MALTKNQVKALKSQAQTIKPKVMVGKSGVGDGVLQSIDEVLAADELVKVKFLNNSVEVDNALCEDIAEKLGAEFVQKIGRMIILYREKLDD
ncbi:MAG: YhbY family RNA-binding protein [Peptococcaceae bacterium]|nr:YhbY family RNA-binding protein [Peptococcaceae bacterium]